MVETYKNEQGQIAVLVSHGYGAGFVTWSAGYWEMAWDKRVIDLFTEHQGASYAEDLEPVTEKLEEFGYHNVYLGGWKNLEIEWIDPDTYFRFKEYDGAECIEYLNLNNWFKFENSKPPIMSETK